MGWGKRPTPPDPYRTARTQQQFNRDSLRDAIAASQIGQETPWGTVSYTGEIGSPDRKQITTLNPQDQQRLDLQRGLQLGLLGLIGNFGQGGGMQGKQGMGAPMAQPQGLASPQRPMMPMNQQRRM